MSGGEVRPQEDKVETVRRCKVPMTKKNMGVFSGLSGYYRCFIAHYSIIAVLTDLAKKD